jgi:light-harvesting protein B-800-850 alpha chain
MNQGRIWCVVNPTVGLPLFLGSVAVTSLIVHYSVLSNTTWFSSYWNGHAKPKAAAIEGTGQAVSLNSSTGHVGVTIRVVPTAGHSANAAETSYVITLAPTAAAPVDTVAATEPQSSALAAPSLR